MDEQNQNNFLFVLIKTKLKSRYGKFAAGFLVIIIMTGGFFVWGEHLGLAAVKTTKNFIAQVGDLFSEIIKKDSGFQPIGQISLRGQDADGNREMFNPLNIKQCSFATEQSPSYQKAIINEIAWMGTTNSANDEWIELKNISQTSIDISGWQLLDKDEQIKIVFPSGSKIPGQGFYLLERNESAVSGIKSDILYTGNLKNSDEGLRLFNAGCDLIDEVLADSKWPAGDNSGKKTMERGEGLKWHTSSVINGTPKKENSPTPVASASENQSSLSVITNETTASKTAATTATSSKNINTAVSGIQSAPCSQQNLNQPSRAVLINEVAWAGTASDKTAKEWIELKNNTSQTIDLSGWQLLNKSATIKIFFEANDKISATGYYLLERTSDETVPGIKADKIFSGAIKNSDESLRLFDQNCRLIDEVLANPAWPAGAASPDYRTAERTSGLSWQTYGGTGANGIFGTPKTENSKLASVQSPSPIQSPQSESAFRPSTTSVPIYYSLTVTKTGDGSGSIISNPAVIDCGENCNEDFISGTTITLTATPSVNSVFAGWSGGCGGTENCIVTINNNIAISAVFNLLSPTPFPSSPSGINHLVISEVQVTGGAGRANNDFIKIYNPTTSAIEISNWKLRKRIQSGVESSIRVFPTGSVIPAQGYFMWANSDDNFHLSVNANVWSTAILSENYSIGLLNETGKVIDSLAWGAGHVNPSVENTPYPTNPGANQSLKRKFVDGIIQDTNNNAADFEI